jgi:pimeloyl-ACP methyl ester carboxylesterase
MILGPLNLLVYLLTSALSLAILGGGIYFIWGWYEGVLTGIMFLTGGIAMTLFSLFGRYVVTNLLGKHRPADATSQPPTGVSHWIERPTGARIYVEQFGPANGPTLILTHGLSMNRTSWNYMVGGLAERCRVFAWDVPGFGRSTPPSRGTWTMEMMADDLAAVIALAGDAPVVLAGHSMGGMIILTYCKAVRQNLSAKAAGLVLAQTSYVDPVKTALFPGLLTALKWPILVPLTWIMLVLWPIMWLMNLQSYLSGMSHLGTHLTGFAGAETAEQLDFASRFSVLSSPASTAGAMLAMFRYDARDILPDIAVPTLVVTGNHDLITLPSAGEVISSSVPGAQRVEIEPSGHLGLIEQHRALEETIGNWTAAQVGAPAMARRSA